MLWYKIFRLMVLVALGLSVAAAGWQNKLFNYWDKPSATPNQHHDWSALEKNMRPEACAQCHESQFNDWKKSLHAQAYSPGMVGQFADMGHEAGSDCLRCHAPLAEQLYSSENNMLKSLKTLRKHPQGFNQDADLNAVEAQLPLRHAGVTCAVCHVRDGQRFGPPRVGTDKEGLIQTGVHGGFVASKTFEQSGFCAECHQFPQSYAINGKPLENTVKEWQQSRFSAEGVQCQTCHMPDRKHEFKGIHDKDFTRKGLDIKLFINKVGMPTLKITSQRIGHAFPTYVTPKISIQATALNQAGLDIQTWHWDIVREVFYGDGWQEKQDTRLMPGETRIFIVQDLNPQATQVRFDIQVVPDQFYKGVYESLLSDNMANVAKALIQRALDKAKGRSYKLYSQTITVH